MPRTMNSIVGRTIPNHYPAGGTITIVRVFINEHGMDGPVLCAEIKWNTGNPVLDDETTVGSIAPGTMLWQELSAAGEVEVPSFFDTYDPDAA